MSDVAKEIAVQIALYARSVPHDELERFIGHVEVAVRESLKGAESEGAYAAFGESRQKPRPSELWEAEFEKARGLGWRKADEIKKRMAP